MILINPQKIDFLQFMFALVRHTPRPFSKLISYYPQTVSHNLYPTNPGFERGKSVTSITVGVLMVLRSYEDREKLSGRDVVRLLGEDHAKSVDATYQLFVQTTEGDERIAELTALWEQVEVSLSDDAVTYDVANSLGIHLREKRNHEEVKVFYLSALERRRRVLGEGHKKTLASPKNMGIFLAKVEDYEGALDYYLQSLGGRRRSWRRLILTPW